MDRLPARAMRSEIPDAPRLHELDLFRPGRRDQLGGQRCPRDVVAVLGPGLVVLRELLGAAEVAGVLNWGV
eukprot:10303597-Alexandrium_andersonii.AAC.1